MSNVIKYRSDIDGLRAIAIIAVIAFHVSPKIFQGGFVGVDMFFIISGYLITSIILKNLQNNSFTLTDFYIKRINRIFPALFVVLLSVFSIGWFLLLPDEFQELGKHVGSGATFISNISLFLETGYFDTAAELKPLLHLWSLGIEEQFYFVWPIVLLFAWKNKKHITIYFTLLLLTSFLANVLRINRHTDEVFFLLHTRFWELLLGALLAYIESINLLTSLSKTKKEWASFVGFLLAVVGIIFLKGELKFPGAWALIPTIATFLIIASGPEARINKFILSNKLLVSIGLISYPLYLWHWPLLSFGQIVYGDDFTIAPRLTSVAIAILLSVLTYSLIEKPLKNVARIRKGHSATVLVGIVFLIGGAGYFAKMKAIQPYSAHLGDSLMKISDAFGDWDYPGRLRSSKSTNGAVIRFQGKGKKTVLFIGDSYIEQLYPRAENLIRTSFSDYKIVFITHGGCAPLRNLKDGRSLTESCPASVETAFDFAKSYEVKSVVIGGSWAKTFSPTSVYYVDDDPSKVIQIGSLAYKSALTQLKNEIRLLKKSGKNVYIIGPPPTGAWFDPKSMIARSFSFQSIAIDIKSPLKAEVLRTLKQYIDEMAEVAHSSGAIFINPVQELCGTLICPVTDTLGHPFYKDAGHFRPYYAKKYATFIDKVFQD